MGDFLAFRRMLMPVLIQLVFWIGFIICVAVGVGILTGHVNSANISQNALTADQQVQWQPSLQKLDDNKLWLGLAVLIGGPILLRLTCEFYMLGFSINGTLTDIYNTLKEREDRPVSPSGPIRR